MESQLLVLDTDDPAPWRELLEMKDNPIEILNSMTGDEYIKLKSTMDIFQEK